MSDKLRDMSDRDLALWMAGWKPGTPNHILAEQEFKRRQGKPGEIRGWISLGISVVALVVAIAALVFKATP